MSSFSYPKVLLFSLSDQGTNDRNTGHGMENVEDLGVSKTDV